MSTNNLYTASNQWASRPADERFWLIEDALQATRAHANSATEREVDFGSARLEETTDGNLGLNLSGDSSHQTATMTHWAFSQLARCAGAPAEYLRKLPAELAAQCLEAGLDSFFSSRKDMTRQILLQSDPGVIRSITSDIYTRFWNHQVFQRLADMDVEGWRVPPARPSDCDDPMARPATEADLLCSRTQGGGLSVKLGDMIAPAGIYASDHDMFAFMVNESYRINDGSDGGLSRGFFIQNSEVGAGALKCTLFGYRHVCGNHIVWGAENVLEISVRHVGDVEGKFSVEMMANIGKHLKSSAQADEARIRTAKRTILGTTQDEVIDSVFKMIIGKRRNGLPSGLNQKHLTGAYETAVKWADVDGDPKSAWGYVNGMTRISQVTPYADERAFLDRAASQILLAVAC